MWGQSVVCEGIRMLTGSPFRRMPPWDYSQTTLFFISPLDLVSFQSDITMVVRIVICDSTRVK